jgi:hypothetical protein
VRNSHSRRTFVHAATLATLALTVGCAKETPKGTSGRTNASSLPVPVGRIGMFVNERVEKVNEFFIHWSAGMRLRSRVTPIHSAAMTVVNGIDVTQHCFRSGSGVSVFFASAAYSSNDAEKAVGAMSEVCSDTAREFQSYVSVGHIEIEGTVDGNCLNSCDAVGVYDGSLGTTLKLSGMINNRQYSYTLRRGQSFSNNELALLRAEFGRQTLLASWGSRRPSPRIQLSGRSFSQTTNGNDRLRRVSLNMRMNA